MHDGVENVAVVTGGAQGIGKEICVALAEAGFAVAILDLNEHAAIQVAQELNQRGSVARGFRVDIGDPDSVQKAMAAVEELMGDARVLVNNAAIFSTLRRKPFEDIDADEWDAVMRVNVSGTFHMCKAAARQMKKRGAGRIISISSNTVALGRPFFLHYVTSKAALIGMTRSMARELGESGITVNAIMPSLTKTGVATEVVTESNFEELMKMQCIKRTGEPLDVARAVRFLASEDASFITGQTIAVDGGATFL